MPIIGVHNLIYTTEPDATREVFRDVLGWEHVDAGDGWLIFALPPGEIAVHPADRPAHQLTLFCDDLAATVEELQSRGVEFRGEPVDEGWGLVITMVLPGSVEVMLYEPRHPTAV